MSGWFVPPPGRPVKSREDLRREREAKVAELGRRGLLRSERLRGAMLTVCRENFIPPQYRDRAYEEIPLPLPGERAMISCPHSYPLFYEPLCLGEGDRFLEVGVGSGYGTALAREVVGPGGLVVAIDIDTTTLAFARESLERAGYTDVVLVHGDGGLGYPERARTTRRRRERSAVVSVPSAAGVARCHQTTACSRVDHERAVRSAAAARRSPCAGQARRRRAPRTNVPQMREGAESRAAN